MNCNNKQIFTFIMSFILFYSLIPVKLHSGPTQTVSKVNDLDDYEGFFNPQIRVNSGSLAESGHVLKNGDCKRVAPTYVRAKVESSKTSITKFLCTKSGRTDCDKYDQTESDSEEDADSPAFPVICAYSVPFCSDWPLSLGFAVAGAVAGTIITFATLGIGASVFGVLSGAIVGGVSGGVGLGDSFMTKITSGGEIDGCFLIPLAPPPPPFCRVLVPKTQIKMIPVQRKFANDPPTVVTSSALKPKIKVLVGRKSKHCDNGITVGIDATCTDKSEGIIVQPASKIIEVSIAGKESERKTLQWGGENYEFSTIMQDNEICGIYYEAGYINSDAQDTKVAHKKCWPLPDLQKPVLTRSNSKATNTVLNVNFPEYDSTLYVVNKAKALNFAGKELSAFRAKVDEDREFQVSLSCSDGHSYSYKHGCHKHGQIVIKYTDDPAGNMLCLSGWSGRNVVNKLHRNDDYFPIISPANLYRLVAQTPIPGINENSTASQTKTGTGITKDTPIEEISLYDLKQRYLDTIEFAGTNRFSIQKDGWEKSFENSNTRYLITNTPPIGVSPTRYVVSTKENAQYYVTTTNFVSIKNDALVLNDKESKNKNFEYIKPADPYYYGLCVYDVPGTLGRFPSFEFTDVNEEFEYKIPNECDFLTVESWGGGASGHVSHSKTDENNELLGLSFSGTAGSYAKATIRATKLSEGHRTLKIKVGAGGEGSFQHYDNPENILLRKGGDSYVKLCDDNNTKCNSYVLYTLGGTGSLDPALPIVGNATRSDKFVQMTFEKWIDLAQIYNRSNYLRKIFNTETFKSVDIQKYFNTSKEEEITKFHKTLFIPTLPSNSNYHHKRSPLDQKSLVSLVNTITRNYRKSVHQTLRYTNNYKNGKLYKNYLKILTHTIIPFLDRLEKQAKYYDSDNVLEYKTELWQINAISNCILDMVSFIYKYSSEDSSENEFSQQDAEYIINTFFIQNRKISLPETQSEFNSLLKQYRALQSEKSVIQTPLLNSPDVLFAQNLLFREIHIGLDAEISNNDNAVALGTYPYLTQAAYGKHEPIKHSLCASQKDVLNATRDRGGIRVLPANNVFGTGGCASKNHSIYQKGSNGKVKLTCEIWSKKNT